MVFEPRQILAAFWLHAKTASIIFPQGRGHIALGVDRVSHASRFGLEFRSLRLERVVADRPCHIRIQQSIQLFHQFRFSFRQRGRPSLLAECT